MLMECTLQLKRCIASSAQTSAGEGQAQGRPAHMLGGYKAPRLSDQLGPSPDQRAEHRGHKLTKSPILFVNDFFSVLDAAIVGLFTPAASTDPAALSATHVVDVLLEVLAHVAGSVQYFARGELATCSSASSSSSPGMPMVEVKLIPADASLWDFGMKCIEALRKVPAKEMTENQRFRLLTLVSALMPSRAGNSLLLNWPSSSFPRHAVGG